MTYSTPQQAADAMFAKLRRQIRAEQDLIAGWRRRHGVSKNPEERAELAGYAKAAQASIEALNAELEKLQQGRQAA